MADSIIRAAGDVIECFFEKRLPATQLIKISTSPDLATWTDRVSISSKAGTSNSQYRQGFESPVKGQIHHIFDPSDYSLTYPFFMRFTNVNNEIDQTPGPVYIAHYPTSGRNMVYAIEGTAPNEAAIADSIHIKIPSCARLRLTSLADDFYVALHADGPEFIVDTTHPFEYEGRISDLYVRGNGSDVDFQLLITVQL
jgi:hypothetical protein